MDPMIPKDLRNKLQQAQQDGFTRSPYVNDLIRVCKKVEEGSADKDLLKAQIDILYDLYGVLKETYNALLPTQSKTPIFLEKSKIMMDNLEIFKGSLDEISLYLEDDDIEHIDTGLEDIKKATDIMMNASDELKKEEDNQEKYSNAPLVNELIRVGKGLLKKEFEPMPFYTRYKIVEKVYEATAESVDKISKETPDTKAMEEKMPSVLEALQMFKEGMDDLKEYFDAIEIETKGEEAKDVELEDFDLEGIVGGGLDKIQKASKTMYDAQIAIKENIEEEVEKQEKESEEQAKSKEWQKRFSKIPGEETSVGLDIKEAPPPSPEEKEKEKEQLMIPPNYKKVYDAAWAVSKKEITKDEFVKTLEWLLGIINKNKADLPKLQKPEEITEQEDALFTQTKENLEGAIEATIKGLDEMSLFINDDKVEHLETGLDMVMRAGHTLYTIQQMGKEVEKMQKQQQQKKK